MEYSREMQKEMEEALLFTRDEIDACLDSILTREDVIGKLKMVYGVVAPVARRMRDAWMDMEEEEEGEGKGKVKEEEVTNGPVG